MDYIPNTDQDRREMLAAIGLETGDELFRSIPAQFAPKSFNLPAGKSELEVEKYLKHLAAKNASALTSFLGAGYYDHFLPPVLSALISQPEFYTAYTPYQAEISQGTLQALFEYQTAICNLTGMDVCNASVYDGGTALYEAAMMAVRTTGRKKVIFDKGISPIFRTMLATYTGNLSLEFVELEAPDGVTDRKLVGRVLDDNTACLILQNPNFFGCLDDLTDLVEMARANRSLAVVSAYPISLGLVKSPGEMGADIVVGEGQSMGLPLSFGGPYLGFLACRTGLVRQMPGRIVGETIDRRGRQAFVLTLQTREQHIRREKATSNICSNQTLCAISAIIYLSLIGRSGLQELAELCRAKACYLQGRLCEIPGVRLRYPGPFFNEFTIELPRKAADVVNQLIEKGFAPGFPIGHYYPGLENCLLTAVTEKRTKEEMGQFAEALAACL